MYMYWSYPFQFQLSRVSIFAAASITVTFLRSRFRAQKHLCSSQYLIFVENKYSLNGLDGG